MIDLLPILSHTHLPLMLVWAVITNTNFPGQYTETFLFGFTLASPLQVECRSVRRATYLKYVLCAIPLIAERLSETQIQHIVTFCTSKEQYILVMKGRPPFQEPRFTLSGK